MRVGIDYAMEHLEVDVRDSELIGVHRAEPAPVLLDPAAAVAAALETPLGFPALRRALTPDDHVAIVLDEGLPRLPELLAPLLEHVAGAHVSRKAITFVCPPSPTAQPFAAALTEAFPEVQVEIHDPCDRRRLSYLATTRQNRRIYLNRTAVDADQLVVLARRQFDPILGYAGSEGAIYPVLSDEATRKELFGRLSLATPGKKPWPVRREAAEVAWLLGAPFVVHIIEGAGDSLAHVVGGTGDAGEESLRLLNTRWRVTVAAPADTVIVSLTGDPARHTFADMAGALACAARVVKSQGRIVLLTQAAPALGAGAELLREIEDPAEALKQLRQSLPEDMAASFLWVLAAQQASIYLLSGWPGETAEELFTTPLDHAGQAQRLVNSGNACLFLADAHKTLAVAGETEDSIS